jgi:hypothetical protein
MIIERDVFQAKFGRGDELVEVLKTSRPMWDARGLSHRILTDFTGEFFTVVLELEWPDQVPLAVAHQAMFGKEEFGEWFQRTIELTDSGNRQLFNVVE